MKSIALNNFKTKKSLSLLLIIILTLLSNFPTNCNNNNNKNNKINRKMPIYNRPPHKPYNNKKSYTLGNLNKGQHCTGNIKFSECRKPYFCYRGKCVGDLDFGEKCEWLAKGSMCRKPYQCHKGLCLGNFNVNQRCDIIKIGSLCRKPFVCEDQFDKPAKCKIPNNWGCSKTGQCLFGSECTASLYENKYAKGQITDLVGYYKTCNNIGEKIHFESDNYYKALLNWKIDPRRCNKKFFVKKIGKLYIKSGKQKVFNEGIKKFKGGCRKNGIYIPEKY